jgi:hypothetical protein
MTKIYAGAQRRLQMSRQTWWALAFAVLATQTGSALALDFGPLVMRPTGPEGPTGVIRLTDQSPLYATQLNVRLASPDAYRALGLNYDPALASISVSTHIAMDETLSVELRPLPPPAAAKRALDIVVIVFQGTSLQTRHYHMDPLGKRTEFAGIDPNAAQSPTPTSALSAATPAATLGVTRNPSAPAAATPTVGREAPAASAPATPDAADATARTAVADTVARWAKAWARRDIDSYAAVYEPGFQGTLGSHTAWLAQRRERILAKQTIAVDIADLTVDVHGPQAQVRFTQRYRGDRLRSTDRKRLLMVRQDGVWLIREEAVL